MAALMRGLVSKKKIRFQEGDFDLDLTYVTPVRASGRVVRPS